MHWILPVLAITLVLGSVEVTAQHEKKVKSLRQAGEDTESIQKKSFLEQNERYERQLGRPYKPLPVKKARALTVYKANPKYGPTKVLENGHTRWSSAYKDHQWISLEFPKTHYLKKAVLVWERAYARKYKIQVSRNGHTWETVHREPKGHGGKEEIYLPHGAKGRFIRMYGIERAYKDWGFSIHEFKVFGGRTYHSISESEDYYDEPPPAPAEPESSPPPPPTAYSSPSAPHPPPPTFSSTTDENSPPLPAPSPEPDNDFPPPATPDSPPPPPPASSPPPPAGDDNPFRIKLYWENGYDWQQDPTEVKWCMDCYPACDPGSMFAVYKCPSVATQFLFEEFPSGEGTRIRMDESNLCMENTFQTKVHLEQCDWNKQSQAWEGNFDGDKFEIRPYGSSTACLSQHHHPKAGEEVFVDECDRAHGAQTGYWNKY